jgi:signal transduction histidine kinase
MGSLIADAVNHVRSRAPDPREIVSVASFIADAKDAGQLQANAKGCVLEVQDVDATLGVRVDRDLLLAALANLLQNAFKFTQDHTQVKLRAYALGGRVLFEVTDHCGGLPPGSAEKMFAPFAQHGEDRSGLGLGLFIARRSVEADAGTLSVRDVPGTGCVFTISLPRYPWP